MQSRKLLKRDVSEIRELIPRGFTAFEQVGDTEKIVGFASVEVYSKKLGEILSLAVDEAYQGLGVGKLLVAACVEMARELGVKELMAISSSDEFLMNCGFNYTLPDEKRALFINPCSND